MWERNFSDKVRDHCHLTRKYRGHADCKYNIIVRQPQSKFNPNTFQFHFFSNYDCHLFLKKLIDKKNDKI